MGRFDMLPSTAVPVIDHPIFGTLRASGRLGNGRWNWEALELIETPHGHADLSFEAGPDGPGQAHQAQLGALISDLDILTGAATPAIRSARPECVELLLADPWADLEWQGAHLTGDEGNFHLHYGCRSWPDAMICVRFEQSEPVLVQIED